MKIETIVVVCDVCGETAFSQYPSFKCRDKDYSDSHVRVKAISKDSAGRPWYLTLTRPKRGPIGQVPVDLCEKHTRAVEEALRQ